MHFQLTCAAITLLLASTAATQAATVAANLSASDFDVTIDSARVRQEVSGGTLILDTPDGRGRVGAKATALPGFDESLFGPLRQVDVSFDFTIRSRTFASVFDLNGSSASTDVRYLSEIFVAGEAPSQPRRTLTLVEVSDRQVSAGCSAVSGETCVNIVDVDLSPDAVFSRSYTGADARVFLNSPNIGATFEATLIDSSILADTANIGGAFLPPASVSFLFDANLTVTYHYEDVSKVPLPAGLPLLACSFGILGWFVRCGKRKVKVA